MDGSYSSITKTRRKRKNFENVIRNIDKIIIGKYEIEAWYYSPFPPEFTCDKSLFICEFCLKYMSKKETLIDHIVSLFINIIYFNKFIFL